MHQRTERLRWPTSPGKPLTPDFASSRSSLASGRGSPPLCIMINTSDRIGENSAQPLGQVGTPRTTHLSVSAHHHRGLKNPEGPAADKVGFRQSSAVKSSTSVSAPKGLFADRLNAPLQRRHSEADGQR